MSSYSLSTSWNSSRHTSGGDIVAEIKAAGFDTIELGFALAKSTVDDILALKERFGLGISSLHNMCPLPDDIDPRNPSPDHYSLAATDPAQRERAVEIAKNTLRYARTSNAPAVILHAGRVEVRERTRELATLAGDEKRFLELKKSMTDERESKKRPHLDSLLKSLDLLVPYSRELGVALALETRYHYREIPSLEEMEEIFSRYSTGTLFYWHDTGHAETSERLGFTRHEDFLKKFSSRLIGVHLHDIIGIMHDHNAPGTGTFDFGRLRPFLAPSTIRVIEAHQPATAEEIRKGVDYLNAVLERDRCT